jgi:hypothetical protein
MHIKGKDNKVADALSRRVHELHSMTISMYRTYIKGRISKDANADLQYVELVAKIQQGMMLQKVKDYKMEADGTLLYKSGIYVPNFQELRIMILKKMNNVPYAGHPGYHKIVATIKSHYFWPCMNKEIAEYITRRMECQKVKDEHRNLVGLLQPFTIPDWKWEVVTMNFITRLPRTWKST